MKKYRLVDDFEQNSNDWKPFGKEPVNIAKVNDAIKSSSKNIFEGLEDKICKLKLKSFKPDHQNIKIIANETGADTICILRAQGFKMTSTRKAFAWVGFFFAALLGGAARLPLDSAFLYVAFVSATTGEVLWSDAYSGNINPLLIDSKFVEKILNNFPNVNQELKQK